jgi:hypothetical protein
MRASRELEGPGLEGNDQLATINTFEESEDNREVN